MKLWVILSRGCCPLFQLYGTKFGQKIHLKDITDSHFWYFLGIFELKICILLLRLWPVFEERGFVFTSSLFHFYLDYPSSIFTHPADASVDVVQSKSMEQIPIHTRVSHRRNWTWFLHQQLLLHDPLILFHFWEDLIWIQSPGGSWSAQMRHRFEHENQFLHLFAAHPPSFFQISQLFHELFQKMRLMFFFWF